MDQIILEPELKIFVCWSWSLNIEVRLNSPGLKYRLKYCWLKVICCICQSNEFEREIENTTGG